MKEDFNTLYYSSKKNDVKQKYNKKIDLSTFEIRKLTIWRESGAPAVCDATCARSSGANKR